MEQSPYGTNDGLLKIFLAGIILNWLHLKNLLCLQNWVPLQWGGNRAKWFEDAITDIPKLYPAVKSILYFHHGEDKTTTQQTLNWQIKNDALVKKAISAQIKQWLDSLKPPVR